MIFELGSNEICQVTKWLGSIEDLMVRAEEININFLWERVDIKGDTHILHDALRLLNLRDKIVLLGLDLGAGFLTEGRFVVRILASSMKLALFSRLGTVQNQTTIFDGATGLCCKLDVGVQGCGPTGEKTSLDSMVLSEAGFSNFLLCKRIPLKCGRKRIFAGVGGA